MATLHIEILRKHYTHLTSISICFAKSRIFSNAKTALPLKLYNIKRTLHTTNKEINIRIFSPHAYQNCRPSVDHYINVRSRVPVTHHLMYM